MKLSLVVPCYNEEGNVGLLFDEVNRVFAGRQFDYEFVFVDDGSTDATAARLRELYARATLRASVQVLSFSRNFGKEAALYAGLQNAVGDNVCLIDADLQQRPEDVLRMLDLLDEKPEVDCVAAVQKSRREGKEMSAVKSLFYKIINKVSDVNFVNGASDFRVMRRVMVDAVLQMTEYHRFSKGILSWVGFRTEYITYEASERASGQTKWGVRKLTKYALEGIVAFSTFPLRVSSYVGFFSCLASFIYLIVVVVQKLAFGIDVPGYATIVVLLLLFGGLQLLCLGVLGEYISKIYIQAKQRPIYLLKEHLGKRK